ncbi:hypothetical protein Tco_1023072, partial [Tanacetum coccineum]
AMSSSEQSNVVAVQNSNSSAQQDALILSVIEQLKTQVINCTKINLDNKSVNDTLTAELERYKEQVKVLKEGHNVNLRSSDNNTSAIVILDFEETLMLAEKSRSKMLLKQQDPIMLEKKVNTTPVDYAVLNQLSQDFETRFVPQTELSAEQAFWSQNSMNSSVGNAYGNVNECEKCLKLETKLLNKNDFIEKEIYDKLFRRYTTLEKHCIPFEVDTQLNQEIFQRDNSVSNQSAPIFDEYFELNELKAQSQEKDTVIIKLKERIKSISGKMNKDKIKKDLEEIETINIELDHRVSKLIDSEHNCEFFCG